MKILVVVGNDKLGRKFINSIDKYKFEIVLDKSSSIKRILNLIQRGSLNFSLLFKMFISDFLRIDYPLDKEYLSIKNNNDLIEIIKNKKIDQIVLYRAGLIVSKKVINMNEKGKILNIHCAKIPEYGGIGAIQKAINDKAYNQEATLHVITTKIDDGEVLATEPYIIKENLNYKDNENIAYDAGIRLFCKYFNV